MRRKIAGVLFVAVILLVDMGLAIMLAACGLLPHRGGAFA